MQKKVQIISDGSQDLSPELSKEKDIEVVPFYVSFDGEHYYKEIILTKKDDKIINTRKDIFFILFHLIL